MQTDVRVKEIELRFVPEKARVPLKFGAVVMEEAVMCYARAVVETRSGRTAEGWGGIFLADFWAFPSKVVPHEERERGMKLLAQRIAARAASVADFGHPIELFYEWEPDLEGLADEVSAELSFSEPMPLLAALVCACPVDAAVHDAFGMANGISCYDGYSKEHMNVDLSRWLGDEFKGLHPADFVRKEYAERMPVFHLVGGLDKLRRSELDDSDPKDGLPVSLDDWVERDGLICLKIKLRGSDLEWDLQRTLEVVQVAHEVQDERGVEKLTFSADTNEQCESPDYIVEYLEKLKERSQRAYDELLYVEQPTERDLERRRLDMRGIAALKPVIVDESLADLRSFDLAMELGWSGVALKSCKCQSAALVFAAKAEKMGVPYTVQDLTNPGIALIHSVGLAARLDTLMGVEANSRQFFPAASEPEAKVHPGVFRLKEGCATTESLTGPGLGYRWEEIGRKFD